MTEAREDVRITDRDGVRWIELDRLLPRLIGAGRAFELLYTGDQVDAETALRIGLGNQLWPAAELVERTWTLRGAWPRARRARGA